MKSRSSSSASIANVFNRSSGSGYTLRPRGRSEPYALTEGGLFLRHRDIETHGLSELLWLEGD